MQIISPKSVATAFPNPILIPITGCPPYRTLAATHLKLNTNTVCIFSNHGDEIHGLLSISVSLKIYLSKTGMAFIPPTNPSLHITNTNTNFTPTQIAHGTREHKTFWDKWQEYVATYISLKNQLVNAIDDLYLKTLRFCVNGYASLTTLTLLWYLYNLYARLTPAKSDANDQAMKAPYDTNIPFENFVN